MSAASLPVEDLWRRVTVVGFGRTGRAVAGVLSRAGVEVGVVDDRPTKQAEDEASLIGVAFVGAPDRDQLASVVGASDLVVVSPGVPPSNPVFAVTPSDRLVSEIELAYILKKVPIVAVTGTNGKTTVVELTAAMLSSSGIRAEPAGNIGAPLIEAATRDDLDLCVAEVSSFQLALTSSFCPIVATWLNFADNHFDWHHSRADYLDAKAKIWRNQGPGDVAIANADDVEVAAAAGRARGGVVFFGRNNADYRLDDNRMIGPDGEVLAETGDLVRGLPHDQMNALAALATALESGASRDGCLSALRSTAPRHHRVEYVTTIDDVDYYDDSKATTPAAVEAAIAGFASVVLVLGGRNKELDLEAIRVAADRADTAFVRGVVAIGEAADEVAAAFTPSYEVRQAASMDDAVQVAASLARAHDAVLLSPGCASFDWYESYETRGDDFRRAVEAFAHQQVGRRQR
ncbi:MAG TPA: UDP-N-acetylmuramoyl-L-alanine--D-glutamate ligase [Acidimicrobiales bacterium]|nr:UDP-N-acetylmuramoyl-L-alanine--D-glutamate ligase [Acidimicrobiales bacterium]